MNKANNYWANYLMSLKRAVRYIDALINFRHTTVSIDHAEIKAINPLFWSNICQEMVNQEIACYFKYISPKSYDTVVDAGAAIGLFSMAMALGFNCKRIYSFEPSLRQRILLYRNVRLNRLSDKVEILPYALWNAECTMPFRTIGDMSSLEQVHQLPTWFRFSEKVRCVTLDQWLTKHGIHTLDLLKMDIEGAEIEALEGAKKILIASDATCLIQAYHLREGMRTFDRCKRFLEKIGYSCFAGGENGLLVANKK